MGRLSALGSGLTTLAPLVARQTDAHGHSQVLEPLRHLYNTKAWKTLRIRVFVRDRFTCQWPGCGKVEGDTRQLRCDHIVPHRGDLKLFWAETNLQTLCAPHHDSDKQRSERRSPP